MKTKIMHTRGAQLNIGAWLLFTLFALSVLVALNGAASTPESAFSPQDELSQHGAATGAAIASAPRVRLVKSANRATPMLEMVGDQKQMAASQR
jgi:hypothetical protein